MPRACRWTGATGRDRRRRDLRHHAEGQGHLAMNRPGGQGGASREKAPDREVSGAGTAHCDGPGRRPADRPSPPRPRPTRPAAAPSGRGRDDPPPTARRTDDESASRAAVSPVDRFTGGPANDEVARSPAARSRAARVAATALDHRRVPGPDRQCQPLRDRGGAPTATSGSPRSSAERDRDDRPDHACHRRLPLAEPQLRPGRDRGGPRRQPLVHRGRSTTRSG